MTGLTPARAEDPSIVNIGVSATERLVLVNAVLVDAFSDRILEAIASGVPMTFVYSLELVERVDVLPDKTVSRNTIQNTVHYDSLKDVFTVTSRGKGVNRKIVTKKPDQYREWMLTLKDIPLAPLRRLDPNAQYYVRVKAELDSDDFGFPFNFLLFFVPFNNFETSWAESSPLVLNPDLIFPQQVQGVDGDSSPEQASKGMKHVIRSFNR